MTYQDEAATPPRKRWPALVGLGVFTGLGALAALAVGIDLLQGVSTYGWDEATCTIEHSDVVERPEYDEFEFVTTYRYYQRGEEYRGSDYSHGYTGSGDASEAHRLAARYSVGEKVPCYIDPKEPWSAYLQRADLWRGLWIFIPLVFVAIGVFGMRMANSLTREQPVKPDGKLKEFKAVGGLFFLFGMFFLMGFGMLIPFFILPTMKVVDARSWQAASCEILSSGVRTHSSDDGSTYSIEALYRYEIDGREYTSNRYQFMGGSSSGYDRKAKAVAKIPAGSRAECFVNPDDPFEAVLHRGFGLDFFFGLIPLLFGVVGTGGLAFTLRLRRAAKQSAAGPSWTEAPVLGSSGFGADAARAIGPIDLEPRAGPFGKLGLALLFTLFWNGIVSIFLWQLVGEWREGSFDWFLALFLTPFVLIGLLLLASIPYSILALVNPRPRVRLSSGVLRPGQSVQLDWSFRGAASRIRALRIWLEANEVTSARSGGQRRSSSEPLREVEVLQRGPGFPAEYGSVSFTLPRDAEPTSRFDPVITWKLKLQGTIDYWPDVIEEYEIEVVDGAERL